MKSPTRDHVRSKPKAAEGAGLRHDNRGAVLAEFIVVIFPLLTIFFVFLQLSAVATATLLVKHGAVVGARAAAVFSNQHENNPGAHGMEGKVTEGVRAALGPWKNTMDVDVEVADHSSRAKPNGPYGLVTVTVTAHYHCAVPMGKAICGAGGVKTIHDVKSMPHQGARYRHGEHFGDAFTSTLQETTGLPVGPGEGGEGGEGEEGGGE